MPVLRQFRKIVKAFMFHPVFLFCQKRVNYLCNAIVSSLFAKRMLLNFFLLVRPKITNHKLIRIGGTADGSYLVPDDLNGIDYCFSPGVGDSVEFEKELADKWGIQCFLADYSVEDLPAENDLFDFEKKYLGTKENEVYITLEKWVKKKIKNSNNIILQMDIEGNEYGVILTSKRTLLQRFRIIVIEFHGLSEIFDIFGFIKINRCFKKLLKDFEIVHIHPNNCKLPVVHKGFKVPPVMEFTFLKKDRINCSCNAFSFPHVLDRNNIPNYPEIILPDCWFQL